MAFDLTQQTRSAAAAVAKTPQIILEIDGVDTMYTAVSIKKVPRYGDSYVYGQTDLYYGTAIEDANAKPYISLQGTTNSITQQMNQDKGGTGSISTMTVAIIDKNNSVTDAFSTQEMLSQRAKVYISFENLEHPQNSILMFSGIISNFDVLEGEVRLVIDNPDTLKRQELYPETTDSLDGSINDSVTTVTLNDTTGIITNTPDSTEVFFPYLRIDDEIMLINSVSNPTVTVTRGQLGTTAAAHDDDADVVTFYRLTGNPIDLALQLMMSRPVLDPYFSVKTPIAFNTLGSTTVQNSIWFDDYDIENNLGLVENDITLTDGSTSNDSSAVITGFGQAEGMSYIIVSQPTITTESVPSTCTVSFKSQYNILPDGCTMGGEDVDVNQHLYVKSTYGQSFPDMDFYIREGFNAKEFIENQLYFPLAAYFLPRKGKASIGYTAPAVGTSLGITIDKTNITNALNIKTSRSTKKNFYNAVIYKIEQDVLEDRFLKINSTLSEESQNRIKKGLIPFTIEAKGLRNDAATNSFIDNAALRILDRYKFGATSFRVEVTYGAGFSVEVGDIVTFNGEDLGIYNYETGLRGDFYKLMEVTNKSYTIQGRVTLELTDTSYDIDGRYGTFAPSSKISTGSTTTSINLKRSFGTSNNENEILKWKDLVGQEVLIHDTDWTFSETVTLLSLSDTSGFNVTVDALSAPPSEDYIMETPYYTDADTPYKAGYCFTSPAVEVTAGSSGTVFTVDDATSIFVDSIVQVSNAAFTDFATGTVTDVTGNVITVEETLGFTPGSGDLCTRIGFTSDEGKSYLYL